MNGRPYTPDDDATIIRMRAAGASFRDIAQVLDRDYDGLLGHTRSMRRTGKLDAREYVLKTDKSPLKAGKPIATGPEVVVIHIPKDIASRMVGPKPQGMPPSVIKPPTLAQMMGRR